MKFSKRNVFRIVWFSLVGTFCMWQWVTYQARSLPKGTFESTEKVTVEVSSDQIIFSPNDQNHDIEIIFFQGGLVDPEAYAPLCREISEHGFTCHLIKMEWRMAVWDYKKITTMFDLENGNYIIGGHSQGGKMAAQFVYENPGLMKGLFLLGTSHPRDFDLSERSLPTIKVYAELDGLASVEEVMDNKDKLPKNAELREIKGGNHSQFGYLGKFLTDQSPRISLEEQQTQTLDPLIQFFEGIN